jgi:hypothetical protein
MKKWQIAVLLVAGALILGATVLREPVAWAAQVVDAKIIGPIDDRGNVTVAVQPKLTNQFVFEESLELGSPGPIVTVPAGKVFVVENLNVSATADADRTISISLVYRVGGQLAPGSDNVAFFNVPLLPGPESPSTNIRRYGYDGAPNIKMIGDGNSIGLGRQDGTEFASALVSLKGYLVDAP